MVKIQSIKNFVVFRARNTNRWVIWMCQIGKEISKIKNSLYVNRKSTKFKEKIAKSTIFRSKRVSSKQIFSAECTGIKYWSLCKRRQKVFYLNLKSITSRYLVFAQSQLHKFSSVWFIKDSQKRVQFSYFIAIEPSLIPSWNHAIEFNFL